MARQLLILVILLAFSYSLASPVIKYVDLTATGAGTGESWDDAYTDLQAALAAAVAGTELWVAAGTYTPTEGVDRSISFELVSDVALYGGFAGTETSRDARDWLANETVLSGDIGGTTSTDNSFHVVVANIVDGVTVDGFVISGGFADTAPFSNIGGGMFVSGSALTVANSTIKDNTATVWGGGVFMQSAVTTFMNTFIIDNVADQGGGMYALVSEPTLANVVFSGNSASLGGALYTSYPPVSNRAEAGPVVSQKINPKRNASEPFSTILANVTMSGNSASVAGGAICNEATGALIANTISWGNTAPTSPEVFNQWQFVTMTFSHSLVAGAKPAGVWDHLIGFDGGFNLDEDPMFKYEDSQVAPLSVWSFSSVVDAGDNALAPAGNPFDILGNPRIVNIVDMGAYEHPGVSTGIGDRLGTGRRLALGAVYPNPFNPSVTIEFFLFEAGRVDVEVYDVGGRLVRTLTSGRHSAGEHQVYWDGTSDIGRSVASGVYLLRFRSHRQAESRKIILLK